MSTESTEETESTESTEETENTEETELFHPLFIMDFPLLMPDSVASLPNCSHSAIAPKKRRIPSGMEASAIHYSLFIIH